MLKGVCSRHQVLAPPGFSHKSLAAIFLRISYGFSVERESKDPLLTFIDTAADEFYITTSPGSWLVDTFPIYQFILLFSPRRLNSNRPLQVRHAPAWMPGAGFQKVAERYRRTNLDQSYRSRVAW